MTKRKANTVYIVSNCYENTSINSINLRNVPFISNSMDNTFNNCKSLTFVEGINPNVTSMNYTFHSCNSLRTAPIIPSSVTSMNHTFSGCSNLTQQPTIPSGITELLGTFSSSGLTSAIIPSGITNLYSTFSSCKNLTTPPTIPSTVTDMNSTFSSSNITSMPTIPSSVRYMSSTFGYCNYLTQGATISSGVILMNNTFERCYNLRTPPTFSTPHTVTNMYGTFYFCMNLQSPPTIPTSATNISKIFSCCYNMNAASISIPGSVIDASNAFEYCYNFNPTSTIEVPKNIQNIHRMFYGCRTLRVAPNIPNDINTTEWNSVFAECYNLTSYTKAFPDKVTDLFLFFYNCYRLTTIPSSLPSNLISMDGMFKFCNNISTLPTIPSKVEGISAAFQGCTKITGTVTVPANVKHAWWAFESSGVKNVQFQGKNLTGEGYQMFLNCQNLTTVGGLNDQRNTRGWWDGIFWNCPKITTINMANGGFAKLNNAFQNCYALTTVNLYNCRNINDLSYAFMWSNKLSSINLNRSDSKKSLQECNMAYTFYNCTALPKNIYLPFACVTNAYQCFGNTTAAKNVFIPFTATENIPATFYRYYNFANRETDYFYMRFEPNVHSPYSYSELPIYYQNGEVCTDYINVNISSGYLRAKSVATGVYLNFVRDSVNDGTYNITVGEYTPTYNAFIAAGYTTTGSVNGVTLKNF